MSERVGVRRALRAMLVASILIPLAVYAGISWFLYEERLREGKQDILQTVLLLDEHAQRVFEAQQLIIDRVDQYIDGMSWDEIRQSEDVHRFLARLAETSEHVDGLWLIPPSGETANSADFFPFPTVNTTDREYFQALQAQDELHFGEMIVGKLKGTLNFNLSRRISPRDEFNGLILVTASLAYFTDFWDRASSYEEHVAGLFRPDGEILARYPALDRLPDKLSEASPLRAAMRERATGVYRSQSSIDGSDRLYGYSRVDDYPIYVGFGVNTAAVLKPWREDALWHGIIALTVSLLLSAMTLVASRQGQRLASAMVSWRDTAGRLQQEVDRRERAEDLVAEKERLLARLHEATEQRKAILDNMVEGVVAFDAKGEIVYCNRASQRIMRLDPDLQPDLTTLARQGRVTDLDGRTVAPERTPDARILRGETLDDLELRLRLHGEPAEEVVCRFLGAPLHDGSRGALGGVMTFADITQEKASEERRALLMSELDHRVRNMLATVMAVVRIGSSHAATKEELVETLIGRVGAMGRTHGRLTESGWAGASLAQVVDDEVHPFAARERVIIDGEGEVMLPPKDAVNFALVIHELATNAAKYGAWSNDTGRVEISWHRDPGDPPYLSLVWRERGGPPVAPPEHQGFGSTIVRSAFAGEAGGGVELSFEPEGVVCRIRLPIPRGGLRAPQRRGHTREVDRGSGPLAGLYVLLVEDEPIVRLEMATVLEKAGAAVVGPAASLDEAHRLVSAARIDAALLDINLNGDNVGRLAQLLHGQGVPLVFLSGYSDPELLSPALRALPRLQKPADAAQVIGTLAAAARSANRPGAGRRFGR